MRSDIMSLICKDFNEFKKKHQFNDNIPGSTDGSNLSNIVEITKGIYIHQNKYSSDMEINATLDEKIRRIVNEEFEKLFSVNEEFSSSERFLTKSSLIKKDPNAFERLIKMRQRKTKFSSKKEYLKWLEEE